MSGAMDEEDIDLTAGARAENSPAGRPDLRG
jgi:hypothetical protein